MKTLDKYIKIILILGFYAYWLLLIVLFVFQKQSWTENLRSSSLAFWALPVNYRMYTTPPRQNLMIHYTFYENNKKLKSIEAEDFFHREFSENSFSSKFVKNLYLHFNYSKGIFVELNTAYNQYNKLIKNNEIDSVSFENYLIRNESLIYQHLENQFCLANEMIQQNPELKTADELKLSFEIEFHHISKDYINENGYDIASKKESILELNKELDASSF